MTANLVNELAAALPPLQGERDVIVPGEQSVKDIMKEVLESHKVFAPDYDRIVEFFANDGDPLRSLFYFCKEYLPYKAEDGADQTSRSPIAILMLADSWGVDCKHYSGWIGGVIDACNRAGYTNYDWVYRFASYDPFSTSKEHVFVVVNPGADEIWLDPAPIENDGHFIARAFNDRKLYPIFVTDKKPFMSLNRISGCCTDGNGQAETMGALTYWLPATDDYTYQTDISDVLQTKFLNDPVVIPDEYLPFDNIFTQAEPVNADLGPSVYYDPGAILQAPITADPAVPTFDSSQLNRIESVNTPFVADYPLVTGEAPLTLPTIQEVLDSKSILNLTPTGGTTLSPTTTTTTTTTTAPGTVKAGFDIGAFIKANPVPVILIGGAAVIGGLYLLKKSKKKKRA